VLGTLPLRSWITLSITAAESHPNDPGKADTIARQPDPLRALTAAMTRPRR
jgi:muconolactone delta-isomerase